MRKILFLILGSIVAGFILASLAKGFILKVGMEQAVTRLTGFKTQVRALKYDLPSTIRVQDLEILNPPGFEAKVFAKVPEVYISFFAVEFLLGKGVRFGEIRLYVEEVYIEKNPKGVSNVDLLNLSGYGPKQLWLFAKRTPFLVERLKLTLHHVNYEDHSAVAVASGSPEKFSIDLNVQNRVYLKIHDPQMLLNLVLFEILRSASFSDLLGLGPEKLLGAAFAAGQAFVKDPANALTRQTGNMAGQANDLVNRAKIPQKAGSAFQSLARETQGVLKDATAATGKTASGFWRKLKSLIPGKKTAAKS
ncbi:MAG: hypothetical protein WC530_01685 [Candidatus Omnitrophota bacterium]|jgi:hypothetical protein